MTTANITEICALYPASSTRRSLELAVADGWRIDKHSDPVEPAREDLDVDSACAVAAEDGSLIVMTRSGL